MPSWMWLTNEHPKETTCNNGLLQLTTWLEKSMFPFFSASGNSGNTTVFRKTLPAKY